MFLIVGTLKRKKQKVFQLERNGKKIRILTPAPSHIVGVNKNWKDIENEKNDLTGRQTYRNRKLQEGIQEDNLSRRMEEGLT